MCFSHNLLLLYLAHRQDEKKTVLKKRKQSHYRKDFFLSLSIEECLQGYSKIPRCALILLCAVSLAKIAEIAEQSGVHHHDGL
jgi:hypothetical protein